MRTTSLRWLLGTPVLCILTFVVSSAHPGGGGFDVESTNVRNGGRWQLNQRLRVRFTEDVDFSSVNTNTIAIRQFSGSPAVGEYFLENARTVVFQPRCPLEPDLSDVGLEGGGVFYGLHIPGIDTTSGPTVRSTSGAPLCTTVKGSFRTPKSPEPGRLFLDTVAGPPSAVVRAVGSTELDATHVLIRGAKRLYFERAANGVVALENGAQLELNLLSNPATSVALMLALDQPVGPQADNVSPDRLRWEYRDGAGAWNPLTTSVSLIENCSGSGALVRIDSVGALPPRTSLRVVITPGFTDLTGEATHARSRCLRSGTDGGSQSVRGRGSGGLPVVDLRGHAGPVRRATGQMGEREARGQHRDSTAPAGRAVTSTGRSCPGSCSSSTRPAPCWSAVRGSSRPSSSLPPVG